MIYREREIHPWHKSTKDRFPLDKNPVKNISYLVILSS